MPTCGKAAARTALPQPAKVSQKVPISSAAYFFEFIRGLPERWPVCRAEPWEIRRPEPSSARESPSAQAQFACDLWLPYLRKTLSTGVDTITPIW
ncbi:hypothetical protein GCM10022626_18010 [[Pseudomonas] carboxydohydrogena]